MAPRRRSLSGLLAACVVPEPTSPAVPALPPAVTRGNVPEARSPQQAVASSDSNEAGGVSSPLVLSAPTRVVTPIRAPLTPAWESRAAPLGRVAESVARVEDSVVTGRGVAIRGEEAFLADSERGIDVQDVYVRAEDAAGRVSSRVLRFEEDVTGPASDGTRDTAAVAAYKLSRALDAAPNDAPDVMETAFDIEDGEGTGSVERESISELAEVEVAAVSTGVSEVSKDSSKGSPRSGATDTVCTEESLEESVRERTTNKPQLPVDPMPALPISSGASKDSVDGDFNPVQEDNSACEEKSTDVTRTSSDGQVACAVDLLDEHSKKLSDVDIGVLEASPRVDPQSVEYSIEGVSERTPEDNLEDTDGSPVASDGQQCEVVESEQIVVDHASVDVVDSGSSSDRDGAGRVAVEDLPVKRDIIGASEGSETTAGAETVGSLVAVTEGGVATDAASAASPEGMVAVVSSAGDTKLETAELLAELDTECLATANMDTSSLKAQTLSPEGTEDQSYAENSCVEGLSEGEGTTAGTSENNSNEGLMAVGTHEETYIVTSMGNSVSAGDDFVAGVTQMVDSADTPEDVSRVAAVAGLQETSPVVPTASAETELVQDRFDIDDERNTTEPVVNAPLVSKEAVIGEACVATMAFATENGVVGKDDEQASSANTISPDASEGAAVHSSEAETAEVPESSSEKDIVYSRVAETAGVPESSPEKDTVYSPVAETAEVPEPSPEEDSGYSPVAETAEVPEPSPEKDTIDTLNVPVHGLTSGGSLTDTGDLAFPDAGASMSSPAATIAEGNTIAGVERGDIRGAELDRSPDDSLKEERSSTCAGESSPLVVNEVQSLGTAREEGPVPPDSVSSGVEESVACEETHASVGSVAVNPTESLKSPSKLAPPIGVVGLSEMTGSAIIDKDSEEFSVCQNSVTMSSSMPVALDRIEGSTGDESNHFPVSRDAGDGSTSVCAVKDKGSDGLVQHPCSTSQTLDLMESGAHERGASAGLMADATSAPIETGGSDRPAQRSYSSSQTLDLMEIGGVREDDTSAGLADAATVSIETRDICHGKEECVNAIQDADEAVPAGSGTLLSLESSQVETGGVRPMEAVTVSGGDEGSESEPAESSAKSYPESSPSKSDGALNAVSSSVPNEVPLERPVADDISAATLEQTDHKTLSVTLKKDKKHSEGVTSPERGERASADQLMDDGDAAALSVQEKTRFFEQASQTDSSSPSWSSRSKDSPALTSVSKCASERSTSPVANTKGASSFSVDELANCSVKTKALDAGLEVDNSAVGEVKSGVSVAKSPLAAVGEAKYDVSVAKSAQAAAGETKSGSPVAKSPLAWQTVSVAAVESHVSSPVTALKIPAGNVAGVSSPLKDPSSPFQKGAVMDKPDSSAMSNIGSMKKAKESGRLPGPVKGISWERLNALLIAEDGMGASAPEKDGEYEDLADEFTASTGGSSDDIPGVSDKLTSPAKKSDEAAVAPSNGEGSSTGTPVLGAKVAAVIEAVEAVEAAAAVENAKRPVASPVARSLQRMRSRTSSPLGLPGIGPVSESLTSELPALGVKNPVEGDTLAAEAKFVKPDCVDSDPSTPAEGSSSSTKSAVLGMPSALLDMEVPGAAHSTDSMPKFSPVTPADDEKPLRSSNIKAMPEQPRFDRESESSISTRPGRRQSLAGRRDSIGAARYPAKPGAPSRLSGAPTSSSSALSRTNSANDQGLSRPPSGRLSNVGPPRRASTFTARKMPDFRAIHARQQKQDEGKRGNRVSRRDDISSIGASSSSPDEQMGDEVTSPDGEALLAGAPRFPDRVGRSLASTSAMSTPGATNYRAPRRSLSSLHLRPSARSSDRLSSPGPAASLPSMSPRRASVAMNTTIPKPFKMAGDRFHKAAQEEIERKRREQERVDQVRFFKARPMPDFSKDPRRK